MLSLLLPKDIISDIHLEKKDASLVTKSEFDVKVSSVPH